MIWLVWRRQRAALLLAAAVLAAAVLVLVAFRVALVAEADRLGVPACLTDRALACSEGEPQRNLYLGFREADGFLRIGLWGVFPALGLVAGAGLFAREFEQRTDVLALTQATGRFRWWATGVLTTLLPVLAGALALPLVAAWALRPYTVLYGHGRLGILDFDISGLAPAAATLLAFALAAGAGLLVRNSLVTVVVTVIGWTVLSSVFLAVRYDVLPDRVDTAPLVGDDVVQSGFAAGDVPRDFGYLDAAGNRIDPGRIGGAPCATRSYDTCLQEAGAVASYRTYQPDSYYWPLQGVVAGLTAVVATLLLGAGLLRLRRR